MNKIVCKKVATILGKDRCTIQGVRLFETLYSPYKQQDNISGDLLFISYLKSK